MLTRRSMVTSLALSTLIAAGCDRNSAPPEDSRPQAPTTAPLVTPTAPGTTQSMLAPPDEPWQANPDPREARFLGLVAPKPATWIEHPPALKMRKAQFTVPGRDGHNSADIVVFYLGPTSGGTVEANIDRWRHQFEPDADGLFPEPFIDNFEAGGMPVTLVELAGNWMEMGARWYTADQLFLAAIIEAPSGIVFIRFAGDTPTVEVNRGDFVAMVRGLRKADG